MSPAYDGWYDNADGSRTFLIGCYSRNWTDEIDVPIGPNNHFEPGPPDRGQPTHFRPNRNFGMVSVTLPKGSAEKLWWVLTVNGVTQRVPLSQTPDYNITPDHASEEGPGGKSSRNTAVPARSSWVTATTNIKIHVTANDLSGPGGGATGCCWTTALVKVTVP